tara:strand:+ start:9963 stop:10316 length:354 start_codon:yes stop_codon:yes gene_type:complete
MNNEEKELNSFLGKDSVSRLDIKLNNRFKSFSHENDLSTISGFQLVSACIQIFLGTAVVALSLLELIQPVWLATIMSVLGSVSIILGLLCFYKVFSNSENFNALINKAIQRVITFQN